ncbi:MAG: hypothetical protein HRT88_12750 [Lentisphaeraceae bacterium]|nr:hypothetical protein [Lentisphaeraceae bacterium]
MKYTLLAIYLTITTNFSLQGHEYHSSESRLQVPPGMETQGNMHGDIAIDKTGLIYLSVIGGKKPGVQIFSTDGFYLRNLANAPNDLHGFIIHTENDNQYLYGSRLTGQSIIKMSLQGEILLRIPGSAIPNKYKKNQRLKLTSVDVGPNGDIYTVDGYGRDFIHRFDKKGKYLGTFAGIKAPWKFNNCHKITIDRRFTPHRILCCDRKNGRLVHLTLDGDIIGDYATNLRRPSSVAFYKEQVAVAEIYGRISILDKQGKLIKVVSDNPEIKGGNNWPQ